MVGVMGSGRRCVKSKFRDKPRAEAALALAIAAREAGDEKRRECRVYRCRCGSWHLTSDPLPPSVHTQSKPPTLTQSLASFFPEGFRAERS
jgi:hypothetical protein